LTSPDSGLTPLDLSSEKEFNTSRGQQKTLLPKVSKKVNSQLSGQAYDLPAMRKPFVNILSLHHQMRMVAVCLKPTFVFEARITTRYFVALII
jgi:hypothetical protein